jgi:N utilization substance protein A
MKSRTGENEHLVAIDRALHRRAQGAGRYDELSMRSLADRIHAGCAGQHQDAEDFAGCAAQDDLLIGWSERKDGETKRRREPSRIPRYASIAAITIMQQRIKNGWINEEDMPPVEGEETPTKRRRLRPFLAEGTGRPGAKKQHGCGVVH